MILRRYYDVARHYNSGDIIWACAFQRTSNGEQLCYHSKPTKGMLIPYTLKKCLNDPNWKQTAPKYFVPFNPKKNSLDVNDLSWSKAVNIDARCFADSESECIDLYNTLIDEDIQYRRKQIAEDESYKIQKNGTS